MMVSGLLFKVPISRFASCIGYCQYIAINHFHFKIRPKITEAQLLGQRIHNKLEEEDKLIPREIPKEEELLNPKVDLDMPRESLNVKILRNNEKKFFYYGRIDKAVRENGNVIIVDDKISKRALNYVFPDRILQLSCYCEGFIRTFNNIKFNKIFFNVIQRNEKGEILSEHKEEYNEELKKKLIRNFNLFENIINKKVTPIHHKNQRKCSACSYNCMFKI